MVSRRGVPLGPAREPGRVREADLPIDSVYIDNAGAAAAVTRLLLAFSSTGGSPLIRGGWGPGERRAAGYADVMREAGLVPSS